MATAILPAFVSLGPPFGGGPCPGRMTRVDRPDLAPCPPAVASARSCMSCSLPWSATQRNHGVPGGEALVLRRASAAWCSGPPSAPRITSGGRSRAPHGAEHLRQATVASPGVVSRRGRRETPRTRLAQKSVETRGVPFGACLRVSTRSTFAGRIAIVHSSPACSFAGRQATPRSPKPGRRRGLPGTLGRSINTCRPCLPSRRPEDLRPAPSSRGSR